MYSATFTTILTLTAIVAASSNASRPSESTTDRATHTEDFPDITSIISVPPATFVSYSKGNLVRDNLLSSLTRASPPAAAKLERRWTCASSPTFTWGDVDTGGVGVTISNADFDWRAFYIYQNLCDYVPLKYLWIAAQHTVFVSLPSDFQGRITRGTDEWNLGGVPRPLGTWLELAVDNKSWIWGDVSLIRGCDGAALMWALDGSGAWKGFTQNIVDGAPFGITPSGAYDIKPSGRWVIAATENWDGSTNMIPMAWDFQKVGPEYVYVDDAHGNPVIASKNGRFGTYWPAGIL
ncbi:hypothetical protein LA080_008777 [Diaporthe eres]|uniref:Uncharacterized protein n=1 Tax=Diaporthe vaccinii TaxID=105482 RepID=A0ABR4DVU1_9PEZI|nr:hypothetical protein LA080_008777 [Diaporthe eres]